MKRVPIVFEPVRVDDDYVVRFVHDEDGDVIHVAEARGSLSEALEAAAEELHPYEEHVGTADVEIR